MEFILLISLFLILIFLIFNKKSYRIKDQTLKKEEIIQEYEKNLKNILARYSTNKNEQLKQKKIFLQNCNKELSRNIFFTEEESILILQRLSKL